MLFSWRINWAHTMKFLTAMRNVRVFHNNFGKRVADLFVDIAMTRNKLLVFILAKLFAENQLR